MGRTRQDQWRLSVGVDGLDESGNKTAAIVVWDNFYSTLKLELSVGFGTRASYIVLSPADARRLALGLLRAAERQSLERWRLQRARL
jgi:hypothetical protein